MKSFTSETTNVPVTCEEEEEEESQKTSMTYTDLISTLPKVPRWISRHFKTQPRDIIICSAPKTGTTWLMALTFA
ncbi:unnamed protein product, partial [Ilex paraguariensis]